MEHRPFQLKLNARSDFAQKIQQHSVDSDEIMVSLDVKSLFTSIPMDLALTITNEKLQKGRDLVE